MSVDCCTRRVCVPGARFHRQRGISVAGFKAAQAVALLIGNGQRAVRVDRNAQGSNRPPPVIAGSAALLFRVCRTRLCCLASRRK
jgi:hypothetical protein